MNKYPWIVLILALLFPFTYGNAQVASPAPEAKLKNGALEFAMGFAIGGPNSRFAQILEDTGFDRQSSGWFGPTNYPVTLGKGVALSLSYNWEFASGHLIGVEFSHADLGEAAGLGDGRVEVGFRSYGIGAYYNLLSGPWVLRAGPQLMFNTAYESDTSREFISSTVDPGFKMNLEIRLWNGKVTYGRLGGFYILALASEHGPFPVSSGSREELEPRKLNFGYGAIQMTLGVRL